MRITKNIISSFVEKIKPTPLIRPSPLIGILHEFPDTIRRWEKKQLPSLWHGSFYHLWKEQIQNEGRISNNGDLYLTRNVYQAKLYAEDIILEIGVFDETHEIWHVNQNFYTTYIKNFSDVRILRAYAPNPNYANPSILDLFKEKTRAVLEKIA